MEFDPDENNLFINTVEPRYSGYSDSFRQQAKSHYMEESHYFEVHYIEVLL